MDKRGFESVEEMNEYMIQQWNKKVRKMMKLLFWGIYPGEKMMKQMNC